MQLSFKNRSLTISFTWKRTLQTRQAAPSWGAKGGDPPSGGNHHLVKSHGSVEGLLIKLQSFNCHQPRNTPDNEHWQQGAEHRFHRVVVTGHRSLFLSGWSLRNGNRPQTTYHIVSFIKYYHSSPQVQVVRFATLKMKKGMRGWTKAS